MYNKTDWKDHIVNERGEVVQQGTPINAANLNNIENGVDAAATEIDLIKSKPSIVTGAEDLVDGETYPSIAPNSLYVYYEE